jgi:hypothetical protein
MDSREDTFVSTETYFRRIGKFDSYDILVPANLSRLYRRQMTVGLADQQYCLQGHVLNLLA